MVQVVATARVTRGFRCGPRWYRRASRIAIVYDPNHRVLLAAGLDLPERWHIFVHLNHTVRRSFLHQCVALPLSAHARGGPGRVLTSANLKPSASTDLFYRGTLPFNVLFIMDVAAGRKRSGKS